MKNTNWSSPKTNIIAGLNSLRKAFASGYNARLIKEYNENCAYPILIKEKKKKVDFRKYTFNIGYITTRNKIIAKHNEIDAYITLNYKSCFGTQEAVDTYYNTGVLSKDNFLSVGGRNHLVKVTDMINYLKSVDDPEYYYYEANKLQEQYFTGDPDKNYWFDFYLIDHNNKKEFLTKKFKHKLWVVELLDKSEPKAKVPVAVHVLNFLTYPLKFIPEKNILKMDKYTLYTFRIGGVSNGYSVEFHIPKKFSFN